MGSHKNFLIALTMLPMMIACSGTKFGAAQVASLNSQSVDEATGLLNQPGCDPNQQSSGTNLNYDGTVNEVCLPPAYFGTPGNGAINIWLLCTHHETGLMNFKKAIHDNLPIQLAINGNLCTNNRDTIRSLLMQPSVAISQLRSICPAFVPAKGKLEIELYVNNQTNQSLLQYTGQQGTLVVHWSSWKNAAEYEGTDQLCDQLKSPLVVELFSNKKEHRPIRLSSPQSGVDFKMAGQQKESVRISWFTDDAYHTLALPDAKGEVRGIDQLFGDSTTGPDGLLASDGYAALGKHDWDANGVIDARDPVFTRLNLWGDKNKDGLGQKSEMKTLAEHQITSIDLKYSSVFREIDIYGNELKQRSTVEYADGTKGWIFDLWFKARPRPSLLMSANP